MNDHEQKQKLTALVRTISPALLAQEMYGVQPLVAKMGLLFALKKRYGVKRTQREAISIQERWDARKQKRIIESEIKTENLEKLKRRI